MKQIKTQSENKETLHIILHQEESRRKWRQNLEKYLHSQLRYCWHSHSASTISIFLLLSSSSFPGWYSVQFACVSVPWYKPALEENCWSSSVHHSQLDIQPIWKQQESRFIDQEILYRQDIPQIITLGCNVDHWIKCSNTSLRW